MALQVGDKAPAFTAFTSDKKEIQLSDFAGKNVLLLFFPQAFTGVCTQELCSVRDNLSLYSGSNAEVLGISVDSVFTLDKFKAEQQYNFPLVSDFNKEISSAYGVLYEVFPAFGMKGVSKRAAFLIDGDGVVQYAEICPTPGDVPDFEAIQHKLNSLSVAS